MKNPKIEDLLDFTGRTLLVTGAGRGVGAGIAVRFAEAGADVAVNFRSSSDGAEEVVEQIRGLGRRAVAIGADVTHGEEVERLVSKAIEEFGRLDVLINNAGSYPLASVEEMTEGAWDAMIDSNLKSVFLCTQAVARQMIERKQGGAIVNIASIEGEGPAPLHSHYNAAKSGVLMHTRSAAMELGVHGIRVNSVSPGLVWREGIEEEWPEGVHRWEEIAPLGRLGHPTDVADACLFLASPGARWVTGANLRVDGGMLSRAVF